MTELIKIFIKSMLIDNVVLVQYLAICPFIGMTNDTEKATGMGLATTFVIVLASFSIIGASGKETINPATQQGTKEPSNAGMYAARGACCIIIALI